MSTLNDYLLHLADNAVVLGQRNAEWCGHGPVLEEDLALANVSLDHIGQARLLYQHAAAVIGGDASEPAISAASILAKTYRDTLMTHMEKRWPGYGFGIHKGYGTEDHYQALRRLGPCPQHRLTFRGVLPEKPVAQQASLL